MACQVVECVRNFLQGDPSQIPSGNVRVKLLARCVSGFPVSLHEGVKQGMPRRVDHLLGLFGVVGHCFRVKPAQG